MQGLGSWENAVAAAEASGAGKKKSGGFQSLGLEKPLLDAILRKGFVVPTPIQRKAIPPMLQGSDVVAMARTGSGKTAAFLIPMLHHLKSHSTTVGIRGLVLSPTRELSLQTMREAFTLNKFLDLRFAAIVGGSSLEQQFELLASNPDIVIATPGRLLHILEEASLQLSAVRVIVLDEADRLFEMGLQPQIVAIMHKIPESAQRALFSATMPSVLAEFTNAGLHNPVVIRLDAEMKLSEKLKQSAFFVRNDEKLAALICLLKRVMHVGEAASNQAQALVFVESRFHVDYLQTILGHYMISCSAVHGQMDQEARRIAVQDFTRRKTCVMVVTDVAARGLDIPLLDNVINYSFPFSPKLFVHRVGRVARAGRSGTAYSIMTFDDFPYYIDLMHFLGLPLQCRRTEGDLLFTADDRCYGRLPEEDIQLELDFLKRLHDSDVELRNLAKVVDNAHKKFNRTKRKPSQEAIREARRPEYGFDQTPLHPMLLERLGERRVAADTARFDLKKFKPKETYLELTTGEKLFAIRHPETVQSLARQQQQQQQQEKGDGEANSGAAAQGKGQAAKAKAKAAAPKLSLAETMLRRAQERRKRARSDNGDDEEENDEDDDAADKAHAASVLGAQAYATTMVRPYDGADHGIGGGGNVDPLSVEVGRESGRYRDQDFFMDTTRRQSADDVHYSVKDATLDITAETAEEAAQQRSVYAWSKKKNRYVKMNVSEAKALLKGIKNEAGKAINHKTKLQEYLKWTKKSNLRIQDVGEEEDLAPVRRARSERMAASNTAEAPDEAAMAGDEDYVDISNPNQGKKLRVGRKQRRLPKDGRLRSFEELATMKRKKEKERARIEKKQQHRKKGKK